MGTCHHESRIGLRKAKLGPPILKKQARNPDTTIVENYAKKNRSRFPVAVLLTTLLCSR